MSHMLMTVRLSGCKFYARKSQKTEVLPHGTVRVSDIITAYIKGPTGVIARAESDTHTEYAEETGDPMGDTHETGYGDFSDDSTVNREMAEAIYEAIKNGDIEERDRFELAADEGQDAIADDRPE